MGMEMNPINGEEFEKYVRDAEARQGTWVGSGAEELGLAGQPVDPETMRTVFSDEFHGDLPDQRQQPEQTESGSCETPSRWWDRFKGLFTGGGHDGTQA